MMKKQEESGESRMNVKRCISYKLLFPALFVLAGSFALAGCKGRASGEKQIRHIVLEEGEGFAAEEPAREVKSGGDVVYELKLEEGYQFEGCDYEGEYTAAKSGDGSILILTLLDVKYSETVCAEIKRGEIRICYDANGGKVLDGVNGRAETGSQITVYSAKTHLRPNTARGTELFCRDGYTLTGWNTRADGSGTAVGLGSRVDYVENMILYAQWTAWTPASDFQYEEKGDYVVITGYSGSEKEICVPAEINGLPVHTIAEGAFENTDCLRVILPAGLYEIEKYAFQDSSVTELWFYDDLMRISERAFEGCVNLKTLHINAVEKPAYSGNYFDTFQDKYDRLLSLKGKKKLVLFSGSSTRFGYDSEMLSDAFSGYQVVNMGVFAYTPAFPQLLLILSHMEEGDILIDSPEFDAASRQFCVQKELDYAFFAMMESGYDTVAELDIREFAQVFTAWTAFQEARQTMERKSYEISAADYDEDGNPVSEKSYNEYGDYVLYRPNSDKEEPVYGLGVDYTVNAFPKESFIDSVNQVYEQFEAKGIRVYFTYAPRNKYAVSKDSTETERQRLDKYFRDNLCVPVISDIEDSLYSGVYLSGTDNHLSTEGVKIRTERIIKDLKNQLEKEQEGTP